MLARSCPRVTLLPLALLLAVSQPVADLPMIECHGQVFVRGSVGTAADLWLAIDTGSARSVLDAGVAAQISVDARELRSWVQFSLFRR